MKYYFSILLFVCSFYLSAQVNLFYFNHNIPQSGYLNPAQYPTCKLIVGIPGINGIGFQLAHNGFTFNQLFVQNNDSLTPDPENVLKKTGQRNYVQLLIDLSDIYIGYNFEKFYLNFSVRERVRTNIFYNKDILRLGIEGNTPFEGEWVSMKGSGVRADYFRQYSFGIAYPVHHYFTVGMHVNLLFGKANIFANPKSTGIFTDEETFGLILNTDASLHSSLPFFFDFDDNGDIQYETVDQSVYDFFMNRNNKGLTIDAGFIYELGNDLSLYGSILDLGLIRYKSNTTNFEATGDFNYNGPPENEFLDANYLYEIVNALNDSIDVSITREKYTSLLPVRIYLGGQRPVTDNLKAGGLINTNIFRQKIQTYVGFHADYQLGKHINTMLSWSFAHRSLKNIGLGLSFDFHPFNFYIVSDNITGFFMSWVTDDIILPRATKNINLQFGFNLKFRCFKKEKFLKCGCDWIKEEKSYRSLIK